MSRWFRHYAGMMRDDKLVSAAVRSKQPVERVIWVWGCILESAAEINDGGRYEIDHAEMAYFLRADEGDLVSIEGALCALGRVRDGAVVHWSDRQFQSDRSNERQKRHRDSKKRRDGGDEAVTDTSPPPQSDGGVTSPSRLNDAPETETETETETEAAQLVAKPREEAPLPNPVRVSTSVEENGPKSKPVGASEMPRSSEGINDFPDLPTFLDRSIPPSRKAELDEIERQLREAAGLENDPSPGLLDLSPIIGLLDAGYRLAEDVLTIIRARARPGVKTWRYFVPAIEQAKAANQAITPKPVELVTKSVVWIGSDSQEWFGASARHEREKGKPPAVLTLRTQASPGNYFPADWLSAQPERTEA